MTAALGFKSRSDLTLASLLVASIAAKLFLPNYYFKHLVGLELMPQCKEDRFWLGKSTNDFAVKNLA